MQPDTHRVAEPATPAAEPAHPTPDELERFMRGELPAAEVRVIVRHLLTGCPLCRRVTRRCWELGKPKKNRGNPNR